MHLGFLQGIYAREGPFATVYLDTSGDAEDAAKAIELRWRSAREQLAARGADEATLEAVGNVLGEHEWRTGHRGQVIVATSSGVVLSDELPDRPLDLTDDERVHYGPIPHLLPYLRMRAARIPYMVAVVDHQGADISTVNAARLASETNVEGDDAPLHKSHTVGAGNETRHQNAVEEQWKKNAAEIADELSKRAVRVGAEAIVLAGDVQQRKLVREQIRKGLLDRVFETEASHRGRDATDEALQREIAHAIEEAVSSRTTETVSDFERERGQGKRAVEGWKNIVSALQLEQVETVLRTVPEGGETSDKLRIGPAFNQIGTDATEVTAMGADQSHPVPADDALVRALAGSDAQLVLVDPSRVELADGIGAVLRYTISEGGS